MVLKKKKKLLNSIPLTSDLVEEMSALSVGLLFLVLSFESTSAI